MTSSAAPLPGLAPTPPSPHPQAIRAFLASALTAEFDSEWEIVLERAKQSQDLAGARHAEQVAAHRVPGDT
jgi:hypothetical protein